VRACASGVSIRATQLAQVIGYGSYGCGTAGVGSDLDLLLILKRCEEPIWDRLRRWDTGSLPLACDLLVYSIEEWRSLPQPGSL
jgi:glutamine synthetase adenylyltransferase